MKTQKPASIVLLQSFRTICFALFTSVSFSLPAQESPSPRATNPDQAASQESGAAPNVQGSQPEGRGGRGGLGRGGQGGPGFGGFGGGPQQTKLVPQFDKDGDKRLNAEERKAAREFLQTRRAQGRGPGGRGGFGPGMMLAPQVVSQGDKNGDQKLSKDEFRALAEAWFDKMDTEAAGKLNQEKFVEKFSEVLPPPQGFGGRRAGPTEGDPPLRRGRPGDAPDQPRTEAAAPSQPPAASTPGAAQTSRPDASANAPEGRRGDGAPRGQPGRGGGGRGGFGPGGFGPAAFVAPGLFTAADANKDDALTRAEFKGAFEKWFAEWDADKSGLLDEERIREGLNVSLPRPNFGGPGGFGGRGRGGNQGPPPPGPRLTPADVKFVPDQTPLYDSFTLRTLFLEFENADWEKELADFYHTDVEVPAKLRVDGRTYREVGVHFRGTTSYMSVGEGQKRSLNLSLDFVHGKQDLHGYTTLNLLNSHSDPTFLRTVLYNHIAREFIPAPRANYVRVVINGESWGTYVNSQQFNKEFLKDWFGSSKGARWKMLGNQRGQGRFNYLGEDVAEYKRLYEIKSKDDPKAWADLIKLCRVLDQTPPDKLEEAIAPLLDIDGILKFLALDNVLINSDGYWVRTGDWNVCQDAKGRFHIVPNDANETFAPPNGPGFGGGGPGFGGGRGGQGELRVEGVKLDPLAGIDDPDKPLLHKLLAVPSLRERYLGFVRAIAETWLDWNKLSPLVQQYQAVIAEDVTTDTHKLYPTEAFAKGVTEDMDEPGFRGPRRSLSLKSFADQRREYLLSYEPKN
ncbi:MAG: spore coat protein CotH [Verrucomicrobia bacterium]|nr:spore coat protein CotH [Verrucomicrobiota bacterium]